jgi:hypothetical protein
MAARGEGVHQSVVVWSGVRGRAAQERRGRDRTGQPGEVRQQVGGRMRAPAGTGGQTTGGHEAPYSCCSGMQHQAMCYNHQPCASDACH